MALAAAPRPTASFAPPAIRSPIAPKKTLMRRGYENAYAKAKWQWTFVNNLQNTKSYTFLVVLKSVSEIPKNVATGGLVYAGIALTANALGIPQAQKFIAWGCSNIIGFAGKGIGRGIDRYSAYMWPTPIKVEPSYSQSFQHYGKQIGSIVPTAFFTIMPWIAYPQIKLASVILGAVGANLVYYFLPKYTNTQAFFYFLMSDIPFYHVFTPPRKEVPHYDKKLQYHTEQFFSKKSAANIVTGLKNIDKGTDAYKSTLHTLSINAVKAIDGPALASIRSNYHSFTSANYVKPVLDKANQLQHAYHQRIEIFKEWAENWTLNQLPKTEQSTQRLYQLAFNEVQRMVQNGETKESEIETAVEVLDEQYKKSIGGKTLNEWVEVYEEHKNAEIQIACLEQSEFSDKDIINQTKEGLKISQARCDKLWNKVSLHNNASMVNHAKRTKQEIDTMATAIVSQQAKANESLKSWSAQHGVVQEAEIVLFNMENDTKAQSSDLKKAQDELVLKERTKLDALWSEVELYNDAVLVESIKNLSKNIEDNLAKTKSNVIIANQPLEVFNKTLEHKIDSIVGNLTESRASCAQKMTDFMLDIRDPLNAWTPEQRKIEYDKVYKHIHDDSLYKFEEGSDKRSRRCKRKLRDYAFEQVKNCKAPLPNKKISTRLKNVVNESFYGLFGCEPFQGIAQHSGSARLNSRFFITVAAIAATLGVAAYIGVPVSIGLGIGAGGIGLGADIGGTQPLAAFGEDAKGPQKTFNQEVQTIALAKPVDVTKMTEVPIAILHHEPATFIAPTPPDKPLFDVNFERAYVASLPFSSAKQEVEACITKSINSHSMAEAKTTAPSSSSKISTSKPVSTPASKPLVSAPAVKPPTATVKPNAAARLLESNEGNLPESLQAGVMLSMIGNTAKDMANSVGTLISETAKLATDAYISTQTLLPKETTEAAQKRVEKKAEALVSAAKKGADVAVESIAHPVDTAKKYVSTKDANANEALDNYTKAINQGKGWEAGKALTPVVHDAIEVGTLLAGGGVVAKAGVALGKDFVKSSIKAAAKAAKPKNSLLAASEKVLEPSVKPAKLPKAAKAELIPELNGTRNILPLYDTQKISKTLAPSLSESLPILATTKATEGVAKTSLAQASIDMGKIVEAKKPPVSVFAGAEVEGLKVAVSEAALPELSLPKKDAILFSQQLKLSDSAVGLPTKATPFKITPSSAPNMSAAVAQEAHKHKFLPVLQDIFKSYELRTPITFAFDSSAVRLNSGFPVDLIKLQNPIKKKTGQVSQTVNVGRPHPVYEGVYCQSDRTYIEHAKHNPTKNGKAAWGPKASINPIRCPAEAQRLLDMAYFKDEAQMFTIRLVKDAKGKIDKQIIRFHCENQNNIWHAYELKEDFQTRMGKKIMRAFKKERLITEAEYTDLITNKWKK